MRAVSLLRTALSGAAPKAAMRRSFHASRPVFAKEMTVRDALTSAMVIHPFLFGKLVESLAPVLKFCTVQDEEMAKDSTVFIMGEEVGEYQGWDSVFLT
jgi:hypothetical protein